MRSLRNSKALSDLYFVSQSDFLDVDLSVSLLDFPLIAQNNTRKNLLTKKGSGINGFFGTGLVTTTQVTQGIPFDFLGMLLTAEWVRKKTGSNKIIHEISDFHAQETNGDKRIASIAKWQKEQFIKIACNLGLSNVYSCVLASEYRNTASFSDIQKEVDALCPSDTLPYVRYQSAGNLFFARHYNVGYKVGWLIDDKESTSKFDERFFNEAYDALKLDPICFVYTWCGWCFDAFRSRVSPYTSVLGEKRIMLDGEMQACQELATLIEECSNKKISQNAVMHLARILTSHDLLFGTNTASFWRRKIGLNDDACVELPKAADWVAGSFISLKELAAGIDKIRTRKKSGQHTNALYSKFRDVTFKQTSNRTDDQATT